DRHRAYHEGESRRLGKRLLVERAMISTDQAQIIGARPLHETQVVGVIDDAGEIGVLVIDPHRHDMAAVTNLTVEGHHSSSSCPTRANGAGSRRGSTRPRWRKAWLVSRRPRGVRWMKPCWIRYGSMISSMASRGSDNAAAMVSMPTGPPP